MTDEENCDKALPNTNFFENVIAGAFQIVIIKDYVDSDNETIAVNGQKLMTVNNIPSLASPKWRKGFASS